MRTSVFAILVKRALRASTFTALCLGLAAMTPAYGQDSQHDRKSNLYNALSARHTSPPRSETSERAPLVTGTELLSDGGFEVGSSPSGTYTFTNVSSAWTWQYAGSSGASNPRYYSVSSGTSAAHAGNWCLYFDLGPSTNRLYQTVAIPSGATATLSFWLKVGTFETTTSVPYDTLKVSIADTSGIALGSITYSNLDANANFTWVKHYLDVSAYAGRTVRVQFDTFEDSTGDTIFQLDDVSLLASTSNASCVEDAYTMCLIGGRYRVTSHWKNQYAGGATATLSKAKLTDTTGAFWIADASTYEYLIRFNTATDNGRAWVAIPTFTDVEFWVAVTDTVGGQSKEYHSSPGNQTMIYDPNFFVFP